MDDPILKIVSIYGQITMTLLELKMSYPYADNLLRKEFDHERTILIDGVYALVDQLTMQANKDGIVKMYPAINYIWN